MDRRTAICIVGSLALIGSMAPLCANPPDVITAEYRQLAAQIAAADFSSEAYQRLERETRRLDALIRPGDRAPVDVVLRRTRALLTHLRTRPDAPDLTAEEQQLGALEARARAAVPAQSTAESEPDALFVEACQLRRRIAFQNPLLSFDRILFLLHHKQARGERHMVDQYFGFNARKGGGVYVLEHPWGPSPTVRKLLEGVPVANGRLRGRTLDDGSFIALDLDWDATRIAFAWTEARWEVPADADWSTQPWSREECHLRPPSYHHYYWHPESCYHLFLYDLHRGELRQLTDGPWNDYDPCFLPDGRIVFVSERVGANVRCGQRWCPSATLHAVRDDGRQLETLSFHETNEWQPSVAHDGRIVYTRWDYVDRDNDVAHHLWVCNPDGTDPRALHGNYPTRREVRPWMELGFRAVPGRPTFMAIAAPHHGENYGSVILVDPTRPDDGAMSQVQRLTPEVPFPEAESAPGVPHDRGRHAPTAEVFGQPWPLDEDFFLCVWDPNQRHYALTLADSFGNREILYRDPQVPALDPIPFQPRPRPPIRPRMTHEPGAPLTMATVLVANVYISERPFPNGLRIAALRIVQLFGKDTAYLDVPRIGFADECIARGVLGTVPVEEDGSAYFLLPPNVEVYFQALDVQGRAVQTMRSGTYAHSGELLACVGCHEPRHTTPPPGTMPKALQRPPSALKPGPPGSYPLTFTRLVQPVLDRHCTQCHDGRDPRRPDLRGELFETVREPGKAVSAPEWLNGVRNAHHGWTRSYKSLSRVAWAMGGGNGIIFRQEQYSIPGRVGARAAPLAVMLSQGHHDIRLSPDDWERLYTWLDCNSVFYGAYREPLRQALGELVPPRLGFLPDFVR